MIIVMQQSWQAGTTKQKDYVLGGSLGHQILISRVKNLGQTFTKYTWQCWISIGLLVEGII
jgi:hypothetical protein